MWVGTDRRGPPWVELRDDVLTWLTEAVAAQVTTGGVDSRAAQVQRKRLRSAVPDTDFSSAQETSEFRIPAAAERSGEQSDTEQMLTEQSGTDSVTAPPEPSSPPVAAGKPSVWDMLRRPQ